MFYCIQLISKIGAFQACQATCSITLMLDECGCFVDGTEELSMKRLKNAHPCRSRKGNYHLNL